MNKLQKILGIGVLTLTLGGCGYDEPPRCLEGKVTKEGGTVTSLVSLGKPNYILSVETSQGIYTINVIEQSNIHPAHTKKIAALAQAIEIGTRVKFPISQVVGYKNVDEMFTKDRIGNVYSDQIEILEDEILEE